MFDKVNAEKFMTKNYKWVEENDNLANALSLLKGSTDVLLVLDKEKRYSGILTERMIIRSGLPREETKVKSLRAFAPRIDRKTPVQECARLMLENDIMNLPVFKNDDLIGVIDDVRLLESVASKNFGRKKVKDFMSEDMIILSPCDKISEVLQCFREFHISRMPVVDDGQIIGIITLHDIITKLLHARDRATFGYILDEKKSLLDLPIENIMTYPVLTCNVNAIVKEVIELIIENNVSGIVVVDDERKLLGIITKKDLLEPLSEARKENKYPVIQINSKIKDLDRNKLTNLVLQFIDKYRRKLKDSSFHIYLGEHKEKSSGKHLIYVRCRINSSYGRFAVTGEGWGPTNALENALINLDKQIVRKISKERKLERSYRRELMDYVEIESLT